jgi:hypothetical protein
MRMRIPKEVSRDTYTTVTRHMQNYANTNTSMQIQTDAFDTPPKLLPTHKDTEQQKHRIATVAP